MTNKEQLIKEFREKFVVEANVDDVFINVANEGELKELESFLLSAFDAGRASGIEESKCESAAEVITDLYEIRVSLFKPIRLGEKHEIEDMFRYNFFDAVIANLTDKYRISSEKMRDVMRKRIALTPSSSKDN